jgi:hypothetical protein
MAPSQTDESSGGQGNDIAVRMRHTLRVILRRSGNLMRRRLACVCWFICTLAASQWAAALGSISGYVLDASTHDPIAGVVVIGSWRGFVIENQTCDWVDVATTDTRGYYKIPAPSLSLSQRFLESASPDVDPYKAGYVYSRAPVEKGIPSTLYMKAIVDSQMRMQEIRDKMLAASCVGAPLQQSAKLVALYKALFEDTMTISPDARDPVLLQSICVSLQMAVNRPPHQGTVGSQIVSVPGPDPEQLDALGRVEPRCVPLMVHPPPVIRTVIRPNPSLGGSALAAPPVHPDK